MTTATATARPALIIHIPGCPAPALSPNTRVHWARRASAIRAARETAAYAARAALVLAAGWQDPGVIRVDAVIGWGAGRKRMDPTNLPHLLKPSLDGVAWALNVNDRRMVWGRVTQCRADRGDRAGWVELRLVPAEDASS